jgi:hypothetical protein
LSFFNRAHELEALDGDVSCLHRSKPAGVYQAFELATVDLDNRLRLHLSRKADLPSVRFRTNVPNVPELS